MSSVTLVHLTQPVEIFGNVSTPFGNQATEIFYADRSRVTPRREERVKRKRIPKYSDCGPIEGYKRYKVGGNYC